MRKKLNIKNYLICFGILHILKLNGQIHTVLSNPSFEDEPADATVPMGWFACAQATTPDILPGFWGVYEEANDGETYVGLITRENGTYESIGQRLQDQLSARNCYEMSFDLAKSDEYSAYNKPLRLRIWISESKCKKEQLIFESEVIDHNDWKKYKINFVPDTNKNYIKFEAFHSDRKFSYKGNILIDNISAISKCNRA